MKQTQLLKGVLDGCVLAILSKHESYGYEIMQALHQYGFTSIVGGTLYPLLAKLEKQGDVTGTIKPLLIRLRQLFFQSKHLFTVPLCIMFHLSSLPITAATCAWI